MNKMTEFINKNLGSVRTVVCNSTVYFVAKDIATCLGYKNTNKAINDHCKRAIMVWGNDSLGRQQEYKVISKSDIYRLIVKSKLPSAEEFESWIFDEILPTIEKTGAYIEQGREQEMVNYYFASLSPTLQGQIVNELMATNKELQTFYDDLMNTDGLMSINTVAKELRIGEYALFAFLRDKKVFFYNEDRVNIPYERFRKEGKFAVKETPCHDGKIRSVTYATKKGLDYVRKLLRKNGYYNSEVA